MGNLSNACGNIVASFADTNTVSNGEVVTKLCPKCKESLPLSCFNRNSARIDKYDSYCRACKKTNSIEVRNRNPLRHFLNQKRSYCTLYNIPFNLDEEYLKTIWTDYCPISGDKLKFGGKDGAHLDRLIPALGYVKGNVTFISQRMNKIKSDASVEDVEKLLEWMRNKHKEIEGLF